jgi:subtilase family serine protease
VRRSVSTPFLAGLLAVFFCLHISTAAQIQTVASYVPAIVAQKKVVPLNRFPATNELRLALALPLHDAAGLTNFLRELYDPASPQFHHYLKKGEFAERFGPTPADYVAVENFARTNGLKISGTHPNRLVVDVAGKVSDVERAFHVRLNEFRHPKENRKFFAPDTAPSLNSSVPILQVSGLENFFQPHPNLKLQQKGFATPKVGSGPAGSFVGNDFRQAYVPGAALDGTGQNVALVEFDGFFAEDITNYENAIGVTNLPAVVVVPVDGGVTNIGYVPNGAEEVSLDIEMVLSISPGVSNVFVYETTNLFWSDILGQIADDDSAQQVSCSWGFGGLNPAAEIIFQQMAAQGQSFFNATGDSDAFDGAITFPSESPNITQVGGTTLNTDTNGNYVSETVWNWGVDWRGDWIGSSGGSSVSVPIPSWQLGVDMTVNNGSTAFRNVPDVALTADNIWVIHDQGQGGFVGGTSCAAPLWAGFTALINQQAAQQAQPPAGFLNPALYAICRGSNYTATFHDVTTGNNTNNYSANNFFAQTGYDLCTGWGTPNGTNLINALTTPDGLQIFPQTNLLAFGPIGGPFSQTNWTLILTNVGTTSFDWSLGIDAPWLVASANNGTLATGAVTNINVQLNGAENFSAGNHLAVIFFTNQTSARVQSIGAQLAIGQNLVFNGGFETGDFSGWTLVGDTVIGNYIYNVVVPNGYFPQTVHSGNFGAFLGEGGYRATLTQNLPVTSNQLYQLSFWIANPDTAAGQEFIASWNGTNLVDLISPVTGGWTNFQFVVAVPSTNVALQFAAENDPNYFGFDDVALTPVPPVNFSSASFDGTNLQMTWSALAGLNYQIDSTTNLAAPNWQFFGAVTATTNTCGLADTNIFNGTCRRFYRLSLQP